MRLWCAQTAINFGSTNTGDSNHLKSCWLLRRVCPAEAEAAGREIRAVRSAAERLGQRVRRSAGMNDQPVVCPCAEQAYSRRTRQDRPARCRCAPHTQTRQQRTQTSLQHHAGSPARARKLQQPSMQRPGQPQTNAPTAMARYRRTRTVERKIDLIRTLKGSSLKRLGSRQRSAPVLARRPPGRLNPGA